jgi:hypothetical protein
VTDRRGLSAWEPRHRCHHSNARGLDFLDFKLTDPTGHETPIVDGATRAVVEAF